MNKKEYKGMLQAQIVEYEKDTEKKLRVWKDRNSQKKNRVT